MRILKKSKCSILFKTSFKFMLTWIILLACSHTLIAQKNTVDVSGTIIDSNNNETVIGATVMIENESRGTVSDYDGNFKLQNVPVDAKLVISSVGYITMRVSVNGRSSLNISLEENVEILDDVVVIGYGSMLKRDVTGAIASVSSERIDAQTPINVFNALQGQIAGVEISSGSGAPGESSYIRIRGTGTFEGGANPLFVVDGVIYDDIDDLNPDDIASIEVLKDAASASIYGSRSANGVLLITTKEGDVARTRLHLRYLRSYSNLTRKMPISNGNERKYYDIVRRDVSGQRSDKPYGFEIVDSLSYFNNQDRDLQSLLFKTAVRNEVSLITSGASEVFKYYLSTGYLDEKGIIVNSRYNRLTARLNADYNPNTKLKIGSRLYLSLANTDGVSENRVLGGTLERTSYWAIFNPDGSYVQNILGRPNPYAVAMTDIEKEQRYTASFYEFLSYDFSENLSFKSDVKGLLSLRRQQRYRPSPQLSTTQKTTGSDNTYLGYNWSNENYFSYNKNFAGKHTLDGMLGTSFQGWNTERINLVGLDYTTDEIYTLNAASGFDANKTYSMFSEHNMASFFGRVGYNFIGKYIFHGNIRYDGSSRFGKSNRWGAFPSASAAWRFSDEQFADKLKPFLNDGKLRISYGVTGNERIGDYASLLLYSPNFIYDGIAGVAPSSIAYDNLSWEETSQFNFGIDLSFMKNRIRIVADYYKKNTDKLLNRVELPKEIGFRTMYRNVGEMVNEGFEFTIGWDLINNNNFKWGVDFNITTNDSRITKLADGVPFYKGTEDALYIQENSRLGEFYGYKFLGIYPYDESNAYTDSWEKLTPVFDENKTFKHYNYEDQKYTGKVKQKLASDGTVLRGGDIDFYDVNGDGRIDVLDKDYIGCAQADFFGGASTNIQYKDFSLNVSLIYSIGGEIYNYADARRNKFRADGATPSPDAIRNMWTKPGDNALYPAPIISEHNTLGPSNFYIEDGSYVKLSNLKLSYSLPRSINKKILLRSATIYFYGKNLLTFTNYSGYDPEFWSLSDPLVMGIDTYRFPQKRELGLGINIGF